MDAFIRVYLPQEQYADAQLRGRVNLKEAPREMTISKQCCLDLV